MPVGFGVRPCGIRTALGVSCRISRSEIHLQCGICTYKFTYYWTNVQLEARWLHLPSRRQAMYNARCIPTARVCPTTQLHFAAPPPMAIEGVCHCGGLFNMSLTASLRW